MNKKFVFIFSVLLIAFGCSETEKEVELDGVLYADLPKDTLAIDTIQTGVEFDFKPDTVFDFEMGEIFDSKADVSYLQRQNVFEKDSATVLKISETDTIFNVFPDTIKAEPFIGFLSHPQPKKAGEMVVSKYSSESIQTLGIDQGLHSPLVGSIVEDQFGFLWFGLSTGLTRYDGQYLYHYTEDHGLTDNEIVDLFIAPDNRMWICTRNKGFMIYDGDHLEIFTPENANINGTVYGMKTDQDGNVWFLSSRSGVTKFDGEYFYNYNQASGLDKNNAFCIGFDHKNQLFYANTYAGPNILNFEENYVVTFLQKKSYKNFFGSTMTASTFNDENGDLWTVSYNGGVRHILNDSISLKTQPKSGIGYLSMSSGLQDSRGNFWFSTQDGGISYDNGEHYFGYTEETGTNSNIVFHLIEDSQGNIWAGTSQGVVKIVPESFNNLTTKDGLTDKAVTGLSLSPKGNFMFSTWVDGFQIFNGSRFEKYRHGSIVHDTEIDYFGNTAIGIHQGGVCFYMPSENDTVSFRKRQFVTSPGFRTWNPRIIQQDSEGNLWICCDVHGLYCFRLNQEKTAYETIESYKKGANLIHSSIRHFFIDSQDGIWISYSDGIGVSYILNGKIEHFNTNSGFPSNRINQFYEDQDGTIWMASSDGLIQKQGDKLRTYSTKDGLSYDIATNVIQDNSGRIWVGTNNGLNLLTKDSKDNEYVITSFSAKDGLSATSFTSGAVLIDSSNTIWWATSRSLISLDLEHFSHQFSTPEVIIQDISITDHINFNDLDDTSNIDLSKVELGETTDYFNVPTSLSLPYNQSSITFRYGSMKGNPTHHLSYRYWLKGFHKDWVKPTSSGEAQFTHLPAGDYEFLIQARLANNEWGPVTTYKFEVRKPFWQTWWFRILILLVLACLVYLIVRLRNRQLLKRQEELEHTVQQRTFEIEQQKHIIEEKQTEILDSINYAQRIQKSLMATDEMLAEHLKDYFVFFQPKDVVSGDFYWAHPVPDGSFLVVNADSTGHGVPGAIMSMLNISCLEKATEGEGLKEPAEILDYTRKKVIETLAKDGSKEGGKDGMDCSLVKFDLDNLKMSFAAAHNGIWIIRNKELIEYKADKMPVGKHHHDKEPFTQTDVELQKGDVVYTFTDGYPDQFGGEKGKKFKYKSLKKLLMQISEMPMDEQRDYLENHFSEWKGDLEQLDDVCIIGVRVPALSGAEG